MFNSGQNLHKIWLNSTVTLKDCFWGAALISLEEYSVCGFVVTDIMSVENNLTAGQKPGEWLTLRMSTVVRTIQNTTVPK